MKIKLAILDNDKNYLGRIIATLEAMYTDKFQVYSFSDLDIALKTINEANIDVFVAGDSFNIDFSQLPKRCGFAYLVETPGIETLNGHQTICKFQKVDSIYKQILSIYAEYAGNITGLKIADEDCKIITFASPSGGTGSSTMAAACAIHFAARGKKTLYLNFEPFGSSDVFFSGEGMFTMSDVIYALKSKKTNLSLKLESCVKQDRRGVYYFSQSEFALDMLELDKDDIIRLISEIKITGSYEYIIVDMGFGVDKAHLDVYRQTHALVVVGDGSEISNMKIFRFYNALVTKEQSSDENVLKRISLAYNKFSNKTGKVLEDVELKKIGGAPRYEHATTAQILEQLSLLDMFEKIIA